VLRDQLVLGDVDEELLLLEDLDIDWIVGLDVLLAAEKDSLPSWRVRCCP